MVVHRDGTKTPRIFYDADVDMPIVAVAELTQEGEQGSDVRLRKRDGYVEDNVTGRRQYFIKRKGVYFMKLFVPKDISAGFTRPGA